MLKLKKNAFAIVIGLVAIALALVLFIMVTTGGPSNVARPYAGRASLVLEILNNSVTGIRAKECMPSYYVHVLYSNDPAIKEGADYYLGISEVMIGYLGVSGIAPKELANGSVIGIDDYTPGLNTSDMPPFAQNLYDFDGSTICVWVGADPKDKNAWDNAWRQRIKIIN